MVVLLAFLGSLLGLTILGVPIGFGIGLPHWPLCL